MESPSKSERTKKAELLRQDIARSRRYATFKGDAPTVQQGVLLQALLKKAGVKCRLGSSKAAVTRRRKTLDVAFSPLASRH